MIELRLRVILPPEIIQSGDIATPEWPQARGGVPPAPTIWLRLEWRDEQTGFSWKRVPVCFDTNFGG